MSSVLIHIALHFVVVIFDIVVVIILLLLLLVAIVIDTGLDKLQMALWYRRQ